MTLLKDLRVPGSVRAKSFKKDDDEDDMILDAKARDKREKDFFEAKKQREEARKAAMGRAQEQKEEREAREKAAREKAARAKAAKEAAKKTRSAVKDLHKGTRREAIPEGISQLKPRAEKHKA